MSELPCLRASRGPAKRQYLFIKIYTGSFYAIPHGARKQGSFDTFLFKSSRMVFHYKKLLPLLLICSACNTDYETRLRKISFPLYFPPVSKPLPPSPSLPELPFPTTPKSESFPGDIIKTTEASIRHSVKIWQTISIPKKPATLN